VPDLIDLRLAPEHGIAAGGAFTAEQQGYVVDVVTRWTGRELAAPPQGRPVG
jgi:hypothetical protein